MTLLGCFDYCVCGQIYISTFDSRATTPVIVFFGSEVERLLLIVQSSSGYTFPAIPMAWGRGGQVKKPPDMLGGDDGDINGPMIFRSWTPSRHQNSQVEVISDQ
jgi:hypothetical protein